LGGRTEPDFEVWQLVAALKNFTPPARGEKYGPSRGGKALMTTLHYFLDKSKY
jgi:hypothetical protein